jgi:hypothetical protein
MIDRGPLAGPCPTLSTSKMYFIEEKKMKEYTFLERSDSQRTVKGLMSIITLYVVSNDDCASMPLILKRIILQAFLMRYIRPKIK